MKTAPFLSIIVPAYNTQQYIEETLESIRAQEYTNYEVIMVDDCSPDNCPQICDAWCEKDERFRVIHLEQNGGLSNARNVGMAEAKGEYITFVDSDDYIAKDLYLKAADSLDRHPADLVIWGMTENYFDKNGIVIEQNKLFLPDTNCTTQGEIEKAIIDLEKKTLFGYQCSRMFKRALVMDNGLKLEKASLHEDCYFSILVARYVKTMNVISVPGYFYNKRDNQCMTNQFVKEYFELSRRRVKEMLELYVEWQADTKEVRSVLGSIYLRYILSALMRNCDKRSEYTHGRRRAWIKSVSEDKLYKEIGAMAQVESTPLRYLQKMINRKMFLGCLMMGRMIFIIREHFPQLFSSKKTIR